MKVKFMELSNQFKTPGIQKGEFITHALASFVPDETVECHPPYITGKLDNAWVKYNKEKTPFNGSNQKLCESLAGIKLRPL